MRFLFLAILVAGCTTQDIAVVNGDPNGGGVGGGPTVDPYNTPVVCTSNVHWTRGDRGSALMHPGGECVSCHDVNNGPAIAFGGTLYPTAHEPDDCNGVGGAQVAVTDAAGHVFTVTANSAGNFYLRPTSTLTFPITAKVTTTNGMVREMTTPQDNGDCNSCHTEAGSDLAPGRIMLPSGM
jgi:hypothetical protein